MVTPLSLKNLSQSRPDLPLNGQIQSMAQQAAVGTDAKGTDDKHDDATAVACFQNGPEFTCQVIFHQINSTAAEGQR